MLVPLKTARTFFVSPIHHQTISVPPITTQSILIPPINHPNLSCSTHTPNITQTVLVPPIHNQNLSCSIHKPPNKYFFYSKLHTLKTRLFQFHPCHKPPESFLFLGGRRFKSSNSSSSDSSTIIARII